MAQNTKLDKIQSETGACPKSDLAKMLVLIGIYRVFRGSVDHGGGVSRCMYVCMYVYENGCIYIYMVPPPKDLPFLHFLYMCRVFSTHEV